MANNVIQLADLSGNKADEIALNALAKQLYITVDNLLDAALKFTSAQMANIADGYILYNCEGRTRAALVINIEIEGFRFPFILHSDNDEFDPAGLLYSEMQYEYLGQFIDYISRDENLPLFHAVVDLIPSYLNGVAAIQAIHNAKVAKVSALNELGIRQVVKKTINQLRYQDC